MNVVQNISLDTVTDTYFCTYAKQSDNASRTLKITMLCNGTVIKPESGATATFRCLKPDGKSVLNSATINSDGTLTAVLSSQVLAVAGIVKADISVVKGNTVLSTATFYIKVEKAPISANTAESTDEFKLLVDVLSKVEKVEAETKEAADAANAASTKADNAANDAKAAAEVARGVVDLVGEKVKGFIVSDVDDGINYLVKLRLVGGKPVIYYEADTATEG